MHGKFAAFAGAIAAAGLFAAPALSGGHLEGEAGFPMPVGDPSIVPEGSALVKVFDGGCILTEGVAAGHDGYMYFSDITFTAFCKDESGKYPMAARSTVTTRAPAKPSSGARRRACPTASSSTATAT